MNNIQMQYNELRPADQMDIIMDLIVRSFPQVTEEMIMGRSRKMDVVIRRQMFCFVAYMKTDGSYIDVARRLGKDEHTTVLSAVAKFRDMMQVADDLYMNAWRKYCRIAPSHLLPSHRDQKKILVTVLGGRQRKYIRQTA